MIFIFLSDGASNPFAKFWRDWGKAKRQEEARKQAEAEVEADLAKDFEDA